MIHGSLAVLSVEVLVSFVRFVLGFYVFWLVLRALEGLLPEDVDALSELDPLACDFTDPFVRPVVSATRMAPAAVCWAWLVLFAVVHVGLGRLPQLV